LQLRPILVFSRRSDSPPKIGDSRPYGLPVYIAEIALTRVTNRRIFCPLTELVNSDGKDE
jgi:hypothetical protein